MRCVALIPARYASTRLPGKALAEVAGKPLIRRVWEQAQEIPGLDGVWVATDDARIRECVAGFGGQVLMTRADHPSGTDRLAEAAALLGLGPLDLVVNIQGDQPLFPPRVVTALVALFEQDCSLVMATPARRFTDPAVAADPHVVKVVFDHRGRALYFSRSPIPCWRDGERPHFFRHIGIYVYRVGFLQDFVTLPRGRLEEAEKLEQLRALEYGFPIRVLEMAGETLEVDTPADLERAAAWFRAREEG